MLFNEIQNLSVSLKLSSRTSDSTTIRSLWPKRILQTRYCRSCDAELQLVGAWASEPGRGPGQCIFHAALNCIIRIARDNQHRAGYISGRTVVIRTRPIIILFRPS